MPDIEHVDITDPEIHEPKGASTANADEVYIADGLGSGAWGSVTGDVLDKVTVDLFIQDSIDNGDIVVGAGAQFVVTAVLPDISTASSILVAVPTDCTLLGATTVLGGAIITADASITFFDASGASLGSALTVAFTASALGDIDSFTATTNNVFTSTPTYIRITTNGASDNTIPLYISLVFEV